MPLLIIALVFFGPLIVAAWMYYGGYFAQESASNHGALLEPITNLADEAPGIEVLERGRGSWLLVYPDSALCEESCEQALYTMRQARLMLGKEQGRVVRVFLHGETPPDTVFIAEEHAGLITTRDSGFSELLNNKKPATLEAGGYFLMDPLGNLVMYFEPTINPRNMVDDIKRLLKLSRIG